VRAPTFSLLLLLLLHFLLLLIFLRVPVFLLFQHAVLRSYILAGYVQRANVSHNTILQVGAIHSRVTCFTPRLTRINSRPTLASAWAGAGRVTKRPMPATMSSRETGSTVRLQLLAHVPAASG